MVRVPWMLSHSYLEKLVSHGCRKNEAATQVRVLLIYFPSILGYWICFFSFFKELWNCASISIIESSLRDTVATSKLKMMYLCQLICKHVFLSSFSSFNHIEDVNIKHQTRCSISQAMCVGQEEAWNERKFNVSVRRNLNTAAPKTAVSHQHN